MGRRGGAVRVLGALGVVLVLVAGSLATGPPFSPRPSPPGSSREPALGEAAVTAPRSLPLAPHAPDVRPLLGGQGRLLVTTTDPGAVPNVGLQVNVTAFPSQVFPANSAFQVGGEETIGAYEAVFGIFQNTGTVPTAFFSVFTNLTDVNVHLGYWVGLGLVPGDAYDFELVARSGTNWTLTVNGLLFGGSLANATFDFHATQATWAGGVGFSEVALYDTSPTVPALFTIPLAFAVLRGASQWYLPVAGVTSFVGNGGPQWGVQGRLQHPSLAPGELESGSQAANQTNGTVLWTGGPVPVDVAVSFPAEPIVATSPSLVLVTITEVTGAPIPGVTVFLRDGMGGSFPLPSVSTNASGGTTGLLDTPNITAATDDPVNATVTLFGYTGAGGAKLALFPPSQVLVRVTPSAPSVPPGGVVKLTFEATNSTGAAESGVLLSFQTLGFAPLAPESGSTDASGEVTVTLTAPSSATDVVLTAMVESVGRWGHLTVTVHVASPGPGGWLPPPAVLVEAGLSALVVAAVLLLWARGRRGRRPLPDMPLRKYLRESRSPGLPPGPPRPPAGPQP